MTTSPADGSVIVQCTQRGACWNRSWNIWLIKDQGRRSPDLDLKHAAVLVKAQPARETAIKQLSHSFYSFFR